MPLPRRSLLVLDGASGDVAKHCVSACSAPRISVTLRKQPPPGWTPDVSELAGASSTEKSAKRKPLSGSAKRRKKMQKLLLKGGG